MSAPNAIAVASLKGGVGKTSLTANLAAEAARLGFPTCVVDLDPQGDLAGDFGLRHRDGSDLGAGLYMAAVDGQPVEAIAGVRPNLDLVPGGNWNRHLADHLGIVGPSGLQPLIRDLAAGYQLVFLDCPPAAGPLVTAALVAVGNVIVPTLGDQKSFDGMAKLSEEFILVRGQENPALDVLGVVLFGFSVDAEREHRLVRDQIGADLGDDQLLFETTIRNLDVPVIERGRVGLLAREYGPDVAAASGVSQDYQDLFTEVYARLQRRWMDDPPVEPEPAAEVSDEADVRAGLLDRLRHRDR